MTCDKVRKHGLLKGKEKWKSRSRNYMRLEMRKRVDVKLMKNQDMNEKANVAKETQH